MDFASSLVFGRQKLGLPDDFEWKDKQVECLKAVYNEHDLLAILPTGYGKSVIFQCVPFLMSAKKEKEHQMIIVITPLNSIMMDQCMGLRERGIKACYLDFECRGASFVDSDEHGTIKTNIDIKDVSECSIVYAHPESLLCRQGRQLCQTVKEHVCAVAVDEAHIILEWGEEFRTAFQRIGDEVIATFPDTPVILFTATAAPSKRKTLVELLHVTDPKIVFMNPDRPNIKFAVAQRPPSEHTQDHLDEVLEEISNALTDQRETYPMTIVYTDTKVIAYCFWFMERKLGKDQFVGEPKPENRLFGQYHKNYTDKMKDHIVRQLCNPESNLRLVFATVALGMGLNAPAIRHIIHYKPPTSLERYFQEVGRAGRDGLPAFANLYYNNTDVRSNRPGITTEMIRYCKQDQMCRRKFILSYFGHSFKEENLACCDVCDHLK